jgi:hypothetical protein
MTFVARLMPLLKEEAGLSKLSGVALPDDTALSTKVRATESLAKLVGPLQALLLSCKRLQDLAELQLPAGAVPAKDLTALEQLALLAEEVRAGTLQIDALVKAVDTLNAELAAEQATLAELAICPTCGRPVSEDEGHP